MEFARVKAGHDKNRIYLIAEEEPEYVYLVNGTTRTTDKPKKKNKKHIQRIRRIPPEAAACMQENVPQEQRIRKAVKVMERIL